MISFILGTAGHIDHGKSALIRALTGTDPDRLIEEKRRGITIELGFAQLTLPDGVVLGVVDVPGHEKFVRQMVAGASGVDIALLVVAADDGVMVQTREHVRVLQLMGVTQLVVALTKSDLADAEWRALIKADVEEMLASHGFEEVPIVETSVIDGGGLDALLAAIQSRVALIEEKASADIMRLPVDRSFTIEGAGCVVTGTLWSGVAKTGDTVEVLPSRREARIRGIQVHGVPSDRAQAGQRVALNLAGIASTDISRGDTVATPRMMTMTRRFDAALTYLGPDEESGADASAPLRSGTRVHVHHAATTTLGRVMLFEDAPMPAGSEAFVQIRLESPIAAHYGDRFIIRSYSPTFTIGGGVVLMPDARKHTVLSEQEHDVLVALRDGDIAGAVTGVMEMSGLPRTSAELAQRLGTKRAEVAAVLNRSMFERLKIGKETSYITATGAARIRDAIEKTLLAYHGDNPDQIDMSVATLREQATPHLSGELFDAFCAHLVERGLVTIEAGRAHHNQAPQTARLEQARLVEQALPHLQGQSLSPDSLGEMADRLGTDTKTLSRALAPLVEDGTLVRLAGDLYFTPQALEAGAQRIREYFATEGARASGDAVSGSSSEQSDATAVSEIATDGAVAVNSIATEGATAAQLRDALGVSRKYAIPLLEYYDRIALTRREGDLRYLR